MFIFVNVHMSVPSEPQNPHIFLTLCFISPCISWCRSGLLGWYEVCHISSADDLSSYILL